MQTVLDLFVLPESRLGFVLGLAGLVGMAAFYIARAGKPAPLAGWLLAGAVLVGVWNALGQRIGLTAALALAGVAGALIDRSPPIAWTSGALSAILLSATSGLPEETWIRFGTPAVALLAGIGISKADKVAPHISSVLLGITAFGVWATVPDTEIARLVMATAVVLALAGPLKVGSVGNGGAFAASASLAVLAAFQGQGRPGSIIGAWACVGVMAFGSMIRYIPGNYLILGIHGALVLWASRFAGFRQDAGSALALSAGLLAAAGTALAFWMKLRVPPEQG